MLVVMATAMVMTVVVTQGQRRDGTYLAPSAGNASLVGARVLRARSARLIGQLRLQSTCSPVFGRGHGHGRRRFGLWWMTGSIVN